MTARGNRRRLAAVSCAVAVLAVTGCQSSAEDPADDPASAATTDTGETSESSTPVPEPTSATPTVEPADGKRIKVPGASMRGLTTYKRYADYGILQGYRDRTSSLSLSPNLTSATSLDAWAREHARENGGAAVMKRQDDVVVGGKYRAWHEIDTSRKQDDVHYYGVMYLEGAWLIRITRNKMTVGEPLTEDEFEQVTDSLLATFEPDVG